MRAQPVPYYVDNTPISLRTTPEDDIDRLAERVWRRGKGKIQNRADFNRVYDTYMSEKTAHGAGSNTELKDSVFKSLQRSHRSVSSSTATTQKRLKVFGEVAKRPSDLEFNVLGKVKGRTVYARATRIKRKDGREPVVYRDRKGHFVSVK